MKVKDEMMRLMSEMVNEGLIDDEYFKASQAIKTDNHRVFNKPANPALEKQVFGFTVSDKQFK